MSMAAEFDLKNKQKPQDFEKNNMQTILNVYINNDYLKIINGPKSPEHKDNKENRDIPGSFQQKNLVMILNFI